MKFFAKKVLTKSLKTGDKRLAKTASLTILAGWKREFDLIRSGKESRHWMIEAEQIRSEYLSELALAADDNDKLQLAMENRRVNAMSLTLRYGLTELEREEVKQLTTGTSKPKHTISEQLINRFEEHQKKYKVIDKTASVQASNVRKYAAFLDQNELSMNHTSFATYLNSLNCSYKTLQNKIFAGTSYWKFLSTLSPELRKQENPFENHTLPKPKKGKPVSIEYIAFTKTQIEQLYYTSLDKGDKTLATVIKIGAYTGCRIEEICKLKISDIENNTITITDAKSKAGNRELPIPNSLQETFKTLALQSDDGYLIPSSAGNKYGVRSDSISKRFGRLKTSMGHSKSHVFHSIRKTAATLLEQAEVEPLTIMYLLGHDRKALTFNTYAKGPSTAQKLRALNCIKYNF